MGVASWFNKYGDVSRMYLNIDRQQKKRYWYSVDVNKLLNYILLQTVLNVIRGPACLTMLAKSLIMMVVVVTLRVLFLHKAILAELAMCENTTTYRKEIFKPNVLAMTPLVIT